MKAPSTLPREVVGSNDAGECAMAYYELQRAGEAVHCQGCGRLVVRAGLCGGPILNADGSPATDIAGKAIFVAPCECGARTPVPRFASPLDRVTAVAAVPSGAGLIAL